MHSDTIARPLRVLLVEDSEDDAFLILRELRRGGRRLDHRRVDNREQLAAVLAQPWDIIIADYHLPGFSALDALRWVREHDLDVPLIVVSGAIGEDLAVEAMHAGAQDYIMKDNLARLNPAIDRELKEAAEHRQRVRAETALRESEEHFRQLAGNIEGVLWLIDCIEERMIYVNPGYERIWEQSAHRLFESLDAFLDTVHPEDYARVEEALANRGWTRFNEEYRIQRPDGSERWISTRSFPIRGDNGEIYRCAGLSSDITARKRLEAEREKLLRALEQTADMVMITNREGLIEYVNAAFEEATGYGRDEALGHRPSILNSGLMEREFFARMWKSLINGLPFTELFINRRKDGDLYYEAKTITPVRDEHGDITHFVSTGKDVTGRLGKQEALDRLINYDSLTGLPNRVLFVDRLNRALRRVGGAKVGLLCVGLGLTDLLGEESFDHSAGPLLNAAVARLKLVVGEGPTLGRLHRDVLGILVEVVDESDGLATLAHRIVQGFAVPLRAEGYELYVGLTIGISVYPDNCRDTDALIGCAEAAMGKASEAGGYRFYEPSMGRGESRKYPF